MKSYFSLSRDRAWAGGKRQREKEKQTPCWARGSNVGLYPRILRSWAGGRHSTDWATQVPLQTSFLKWNLIHSYLFCPILFYGWALSDDRFILYLLHCIPVWSCWVTPCLQVQLLSVPYGSHGLSLPGPHSASTPDTCFLPLCSLHLSNSYSGQGQGLSQRFSGHLTLLWSRHLSPHGSPFFGSSPPLECRCHPYRDLDFSHVSQEVQEEVSKNRWAEEGALNTEASEWTMMLTSGGNSAHKMLERRFICHTSADHAMTSSMAIIL